VRPSKDITPYRWEQGTLPFELLAGVEEAVEYIADLSPFAGTRRERLLASFARIEAHELNLALRLEAGLRSIRCVTVYGVPAHGRRIPTFALNVEGVAPLSVVKQLARKNICAWSGNYYAVNVMERLGFGDTGAVRLRIAHYLDENDVDRVVEGLREVVEGYIRLLTYIVFMYVVRTFSTSQLNGNGHIETFRRNYHAESSRLRPGMSG
jgi:selenocysteine lyase/cysteine desulfurase